MINIKVGEEYARYDGSRPVIVYSQIKNLIKSKKVRTDSIIEIEFGEYPQYVVENEKFLNELETLWAHGIEERLEKIQEIKLSERTK